MKRKASRVLASIIAVTILCGIIAAAVLHRTTVEPNELTAEPSNIAARNYASMSKGEYIDWLLSGLTIEEKCAIIEGNTDLAAEYGVRARSKAWNG